jgi:hypothetical protein
VVSTSCARIPRGSDRRSRAPPGGSRSRQAVDGGVEAVEGADVLAAEVDVHERRQLARLEELRLERRVAAREVLEHLAHVAAVRLDLTLAADLGAQRGRNADRRHVATRGPAQNCT